MIAEPPVQVDQSDDEATPVCFKCFAPFRLGTTVCRHCGGPLSAYAMALPFEGALQEGRLLGEATLLSAPSLGIVIGVWIVAAPAMAFLLAFALGFLRQGWDDVPWPLMFLASLGSVVWASLLVYVAFLTTSHWRRAKRSPADRTD